MPNQTTPEDGESPSSRAGKLKKVAFGAAAFVAAAVLIKLARGQHAAEADESLEVGTPASSEPWFEDIVHAVAESVARLERVSTNGFNVAAQFRSKRGRQVWTADYHFDGETGDYRYSHPYPGAGSPRTFGDKVRQRIREDRQSVPTD